MAELCDDSSVHLVKELLVLAGLVCFVVVLVTGVIGLSKKHVTLHTIVHHKLVNNIIGYEASVLAELELGEVHWCLGVQTVKLLVHHAVLLLLGQVLDVVSDLVGIVHVGDVFILLIVLGWLVFLLVLFF